MDLVKIEDMLHKACIVSDGINDFHAHSLDVVAAQGIQGNIRRVHDMIGIDFPAALVYGFGYLFGRRSAVAGVVFDAEIAVWAAGIVAG